MVIIPFELTPQSLLSDPEWLARHDTPPPETDEIDTDNISGYDRQVIEELMGLKPVSEEMVTEIKRSLGFGHQNSLLTRRNLECCWNPSCRKINLPKPFPR